MIPGLLADISFVRLEALIGEARESKTLEFKSEMPDTVKLIQGVSAFANTVGGDFVIGVSTTDDGVASSIDGVTVPNLDGAILALEQRIRDGLQPRLPRVDVKAIPCPIEGKAVLVIRVPRSWVGPHRALADSKFYGRNSSGKYPLDVSELRTAFLLGESTEERIRRFKADRLTKIVAASTPAPLGPGAVILHVTPAPAPTSFGVQDFVAALQGGSHFPLPLEGASTGNRYRFNLDGVVNTALVRADGISSYAQLFRSGAIEGASPLGLRDDGRIYLHGQVMARKLVAAARQYVSVLNALEAAFPVFAFISVCAEGGFYMRSADTGGAGWQDHGPLTGPVVTLPEVAIASADDDVAAALRPALDALWNGFGFAGCELYSSSGAWISR